MRPQIMKMIPMTSSECQWMSWSWALIESINYYQPQGCLPLRIASSKVPYLFSLYINSKVLELMGKYTLKDGLDVSPIIEYAIQTNMW